MSDLSKRPPVKLFVLTPGGVSVHETYSDAFVRASDVRGATAVLTYEDGKVGFIRYPSEGFQ